MSELETFGQRAKLLSQKLTNCAIGVKTTDSAHGTRISGQFCAAIFHCEDKRLKTVYLHRGGKRRYQVCGSRELCNQQTVEPVYYEVPK
jgi:hypothetical protein